MKRIISSLLLLTLAFGLVACSNNSESETANSASTTSTSDTGNISSKPNSSESRQSESVNSELSQSTAVSSSSATSTTESSLTSLETSSSATTESSSDKSTESVPTPSENANIGEFNFERKTVMLNSGYEMPIMGLGTYSLTDEECYNSVTALLQSGGRLIDTAYMYGNEAAVGRAIRDSNVPREEIFVITKIYPGGQFQNPEKAIQDALDKLDIGYIDMMLLHHPGENDVKAYLAMEKFVADGKIHSLGLSNFYVEELQEFLPQVNITPALVQNEIHPYYQEQAVVPYIQNLGIVVQGWYPFGGRGHTSELLGDETLNEIANAHGVTAAQVILRWNLQRGVVVIPGSGNPDHIKENLDIFGFELSDIEMEKIAKLNRDEKHDWY